MAPESVIEKIASHLTAASEPVIKKIVWYGVSSKTHDCPDREELARLTR